MVFDGDCGFCTWAADRLRRWSEGRLEVLPWQVTDLEPLGLTAEECAGALQLVGPGVHAAGGEAVARALRECRQPWRLVGAVLAMPVVAPAAEWGYARVAANRHRLPGATPACRIA